jgi:cytochrome c-type biogenesis protein CcmH/NrfG
VDRLDLETWLERVRQSPDDALAWQAVGVAYVESGRWKDATTAFERSLRLDPHNPAAAEGLVLATRQTRAWEAVRPLLETSDTAPAAFGLGLAAFERGEMEEAAERFKTVVGAEPERAEAWYDLGAAWANQERWDEAADAFARFVRLEPDDVAGWRGLGRASSARGRSEEAVEAYRTAIRIGGDGAACHLQLGKALGDLGRWKEASEALRDAARLDPQNAAAFIALAFAYGRMARDPSDPRWPRERALRAEAGALEAALRLDPGNARGWRSLARAREGLGDHAGARDAVARASALNREAEG